MILRKRDKAERGFRVEFSDRAGTVCGPACRAQAIRDRAIERGLSRGWPGL